jgi:hypothetical protein
MGLQGLIEFIAQIFIGKDRRIRRGGKDFEESHFAFWIELRLEVLKNLFLQNNNLGTTAKQSFDLLHLIRHFHVDGAFGDGFGVIAPHDIAGVLKGDDVEFGKILDGTDLDLGGRW